MENLLKAIIIAIIQGVTEWLPVSSSGHLIIFESLLNYQVSLAFDVALHFGTLMSVFVYFGKDITDIIQDMLKLKFKSDNGLIGICLMIATIPAAIIGYVMKDLPIFKNLILTAVGFSITGLLLIIASLNIKIKKEKLNKKNAMIIGIAQAFALFPGISRSGTTISTGILSGLKEETALKFSFLMSIPIIFGANIATIGSSTLPREMILATITAFIIGLISLHFLYTKVLTKKRNLRWFGFYALGLSIAIFIYLIL